MEIVEQLIGYTDTLAASWREMAAEAFTFVVAGYPEAASHLDSLPLYCTMLLAAAVLMLSRRLRRTRAALGGLAAEVELLRSCLPDTQRLQREYADRLNRLHCDTADLLRRQRSLEARLGKPDVGLAAAMTRAGAQRQQMVDCGLSHGEVHLLHALNSAKCRNVSAAPQ